MVIAVVCEEWDMASEQSIKIFWKFRLDKLSELQSFERFNHVDSMKDIKDGWIKSLFEYLDIKKTLMGVKYKNIGWTKKPFSQVEYRTQYEHPEKYFHDDLCKKINQSRSLEADLYWLEREGGAGRGGKVKVVLKWIGKCILYVLIITMGAFTFGLLFPKGIPDTGSFIGYWC